MTSATLPASRAFWRSVPVVLVAGCAIGAIGFGPRSTMGFFLTPMSTEYGWGREVFALAIAIQNLVWGIGQPFVGMLADRFGTARVLTGGALLYGLGLALMANTSDPLTLQFTAGVLIGLGIAGSAFLLVLAAFARLLPPHLRTIGFGLGTAAGSLGQFIFAPLGQGFIEGYGWQTALLIMAAITLAVPFLAFVIRGKPEAVPVRAGEADQSIPEALREAFRHRSYQLLVAGFFVCGFQIAFITVHLPPYLADIGIPALYGGYAIALIGLFNIIGSISSGVLTGRMPKRILLAFI
ncbi:MAG: MFS transporter, partial [Bauldia sp.]|nr:MFS transporter [Bauldia sp.]